MRKVAWMTALLVLAVLAVSALPGSGRARWRRWARQSRRQVRFRKGRLKGLVYRLRHRQPDPDVRDSVLADRIRSTLGPLEARFDLPHIHVMAEDHIALLHGDVASAEQADEIERVVAAVSGVAGVDSYLHVGLLPSDTRPSHGRRVQAPSDALRELLAAAIDAGTGPQHAPRAVRAVLSTFFQRLPAGERQQVAAHLPADVRRLAAEPRRIGLPPTRTRTVAELTRQVIAANGMSLDEAQPVVTAVLGTLRKLVPDEAADVASVLPAELRELWQTAP